MNTIFIICAVLAGILTLFALFGGLFAMARGGEFNEKYGNKFMQARVIMQGIAIGLLALGYALSQSPPTP